MPGGIGIQPRSMVLEFLKSHDGEATSREIGQVLSQNGYSYPPSRVLRVLEDEGIVERGENGYQLTQEGWDHEEQDDQGGRGHYQNGRSAGQGRSQGQEGGFRSQGRSQEEGRQQNSPGRSQEGRQQQSRRQEKEQGEQGLARCRQLIDRLLEINAEEKEVALELDQELDNLSDFEDVMPALQKLLQGRRGNKNRQNQGQGSQGRQREEANA